MTLILALWADRLSPHLSLLLLKLLLFSPYLLHSNFSGPPDAAYYLETEFMPDEGYFLFIFKEEVLEYWGNLIHYCNSSVVPDFRGHQELEVLRNRIYFSHTSLE